jgi:hypothetical protein
MPTMRAVQVARSGGPLELVGQPIPAAAPAACGLRSVPKASVTATC